MTEVSSNIINIENMEKNTYDLFLNYLGYEGWVIDVIPLDSDHVEYQSSEGKRVKSSVNDYIHFVMNLERYKKVSKIVRILKNRRQSI